MTTPATTKKSQEADKDDSLPQTPTMLERQFRHANYLQGAQFLQKMAAVAVVNNHYPLQLQLERQIIKKQWHVVSCLKLQTKVLQGLSSNDFFLAMVRGNVG